MKATERLWLTADKGRLVAEGDPKAAFLYAAAGDEIPDEAAERFGLIDGALDGKRGKKAEDKSVAPRGAPTNEDARAARDGPDGDKASDTQDGKPKGGGLSIFKTK